jgi:hypothetical protein
MVANAGINTFKPLFESASSHVPLTGLTDLLIGNAVTTDDWDRIMSINARSMFLCYKYAGLVSINAFNWSHIQFLLKLYSKWSGKEGPDALLAPRHWPEKKAMRCMRDIARRSSLCVGLLKVLVRLELSVVVTSGLINIQLLNSERWG